MSTDIDPYVETIAKLYFEESGKAFDEARLGGSAQGVGAWERLSDVWKNAHRAAARAVIERIYADYETPTDYEIGVTNDGFVFIDKPKRDEGFLAGIVRKLEERKAKREAIVWQCTRTKPKPCDWSGTKHANYGGRKACLKCFAPIEATTASPKPQIHFLKNRALGKTGAAQMTRDAVMLAANAALVAEETAILVGMAAFNDAWYCKRRTYCGWEGPRPYVSNRAKGMNQYRCPECTSVAEPNPEVIAKLKIEVRQP